MPFLKKELFKASAILSAMGACLLAAPTCPCSAQQGGGLWLEPKDLGADGRTPAGWSAWSERDEIRPKCHVDSGRFRSVPGALAISGDGNPLEHGGWAHTVNGIRAGQYYRLTAYYGCRSVQDEARQVVARLDWLDAQGKRTGQPDYAYETAADGRWTRVTLRVPAPPGAAGVRVELGMGWAPDGTVWWDDITFEEAQPPPARWVRVGTVSLHPRDNPDNLGAYLQAIDDTSNHPPDIVCLGEEILLEGNSRTYASAAEAIPGPSTSRLGERARRYAMYIVAGLTERDGRAVYNTAVLIDRHGSVAGKYRKVYLPREEVEGGLTPGRDLPVFETDFGRIGMMICWDSEYVDPARALALRGAEIVFVPAAGGYLTLLKARALENHLYVVTSGFDVETAIINPAGDVLFATKESGAHGTISINLGDRPLDPWLGDMRARLHKETRRDIPIPAPADR
jgi:predicted amidohydrolase